MKKTILVNFVLCLVLLIFSVSLSQSSEPNSSCLQTCTKSVEETCSVYPNSPLCPDDITKTCKISCEKEIAFLNQEFSLYVGEKVIVQDYDNMEIKLLDFNRSTRERYIAKLKVMKGNEVKFVSVNNRNSVAIFGVRIDFISPVMTVYPVEFNEETKKWEGGGTSEPYAGLFGVYEKREPTFWQRVSDFVRRLFRADF